MQTRQQSSQGCNKFSHFYVSIRHHFLPKCCTLLSSHLCCRVFRLCAQIPPYFMFFLLLAEFPVVFVYYLILVPVMMWDVTFFSHSI